MNSQELWRLKALDFQEKLYKKIGHEDTLRAALCLQEARLRALAAILLRDQQPDVESLHQAYCRALDDLAAHEFDFSILSSFPFD